MPSRIDAPFGYVEQRELMYLRELKATSAHLAAIVVLRVRENHTGTTEDTLASLARFAGMSEMSMRRAVHWLIAHGLLAEFRERRKGGPQGAGWLWRRRLSPFDRWPQAARTALPDSLSDEKSDSHGSALPKSRSEGAEEPLTQVGRGDQTTRHNPDVPPEVLPDDGAYDSTKEPFKDGLRLLHRLSWYPYDELNDSAILLGTPNLSGSDITDEIARWIRFCATKERPDQPRAALRAWLLKAPEIRAQRHIDRERIEAREQIPPRTYEELRAIKAAGCAI